MLFTQIISFILNVVFGLLVGAALLRCYMNAARVPLANPLGQFILAITDWLVRPLRKLLPAAGRFDWASFLAAVLLALLHAGLFAVLVPELVTAMGGILFFALQELLRVALQGLMLLLVVYAVLSWVSSDSPLYNILARMFAPLLAPIRRAVPLVGGVDLSPLILIVLLQIGLIALARL
jgi:YggT family protein